MRYEAEDGTWTVSDSDDSKKEYNVPVELIVVLSDGDNQQKFMRGNHVMAMYPDTTSFYPATVQVCHGPYLSSSFFFVG